MRGVAGVVVLLCIGVAGCATAPRPRESAERLLETETPEPTRRAESIEHAAVRADGMEVIARAEWDWPLRTLDGEPLSFEEFRGRVVFLNLWATWCPPCVAELASIAELRASLDDDRIAFLLVSPERAEPVRAFLRRHGYDLPVLLEDGRMPEVFGLRALPTTFVIAPEGDVVLRHRGAADWDDDALRELLRSLAAGVRAGAEVAER